MNREKPMSESPSLNGANGNGRDQRGRWAAGNRGGKGNPYSKRVNRLRAMLFRVCDPVEMQAAILEALRQARGNPEAGIKGDTGITFALWDRMVGRPTDTDIRNPLDALIWELDHEGDKATLRRFAVEMKNTLPPKPPAEPAESS